MGFIPFFNFILNATVRAGRVWAALLVNAFVSEAQVGPIYEQANLITKPSLIPDFIIVAAEACNKTKTHLWRRDPLSHHPDTSNFLHERTSFLPAWSVSCERLMFAVQLVVALSVSEMLMTFRIN